MESLDELSGQISALEAMLPNASLIELPEIEKQLLQLDEKWAKAVSDYRSKTSSESQGGIPFAVLESLQSRWSNDLRKLNSETTFLIQEALQLSTLFLDLFSQLLTPFLEDHEPSLE